MTDLVAAVCSYADRFHRAVRPGHHVASPLGAWLVLALAGSAAHGAARDELAAVLGMDVDAASAAAAGLLDHPHDAVAAGAAMWHRPEAATDALRAWERGLPAPVERGDVPSQAAADAWAHEHTYGLIRQFPLPMTADVLVVLASALATRVTWQTPFDTAPADVLGDSAWARRLDTVLRTPGRPYGHRQFIARTRQAGEVAVHTASSANGLAVTSVIAAPDVAPPDVLAAAHEIATGEPQAVSLFHLPLGGGHSWTISEESAEVRGGREERYATVLPAWSARSEHELAKQPSLGFPAAGAVLKELVVNGQRIEAKQAAMARYSRVGFEAAAVTAMAVASAAIRSSSGLRRTAELRFARPYAVVAVCAGGGPWDGLPAFSAWVAEPSDAGSASADE